MGGVRRSCPRRPQQRRPVSLPACPPSFRRMRSFDGDCCRMGRLRSRSRSRSPQRRRSRSRDRWAARACWLCAGQLQQVVGVPTRAPAVAASHRQQAACPAACPALDQRPALPGLLCFTPSSIPRLLTVPQAAVAQHGPRAAAVAQQRLTGPKRQGPACTALSSFSIDGAETRHVHACLLPAGAAPCCPVLPCTSCRMLCEATCCTTKVSSFAQSSGGFPESRERSPHPTFSWFRQKHMPHRRRMVCALLPPCGVPCLQRIVDWCLQL